jgi:hypothetical protein
LGKPAFRLCSILFCANTLPGIAVSHPGCLLVDKHEPEKVENLALIRESELRVRVKWYQSLALLCFALLRVLRLQRSLALALNKRGVVKSAISRRFA